MGFFVVMLAPVALLFGLILVVWILVLMFRSGIRWCIEKLLNWLGTTPPTP